MKKVLVMIAIAGSLAACNNGTDNSATTSDSATMATPSTVDSNATTTTTAVDSTSATAPAIDSTTSGTSRHAPERCASRRPTCAA